jgi:hypothetical protein
LEKQIDFCGNARCKRDKHCAGELPKGVKVVLFVRIVADKSDRLATMDVALFCFLSPEAKYPRVSISTITMDELSSCLG